MGLVGRWGRRAVRVAAALAGPAGPAVLAGEPGPAVPVGLVGRWGRRAVRVAAALAGPAGPAVRLAMRLPISPGFHGVQVNCGTQIIGICGFQPAGRRWSCNAAANIARFPRRPGELRHANYRYLRLPACRDHVHRKTYLARRCTPSKGSSAIALRASTQIQVPGHSHVHRKTYLARRCTPSKGSSAIALRASTQIQVPGRTAACPFVARTRRPPPLVRPTGTNGGTRACPPAPPAPPRARSSPVPAGHRRLSARPELTAARGPARRPSPRGTDGLGMTTLGEGEGGDVRLRRSSKPTPLSIPPRDRRLRNDDAWGG